MYQIKYSYSSEYISYDDGCHLRKFCRNPIRRDLTPTTKKLASLYQLWLIKCILLAMLMRGVWKIATHAKSKNLKT